MLKPSARSNPPFGYKAVIVYPDGHTYQPLRKNFKTREDALAYSVKWIQANRGESK